MTATYDPSNKRDHNTKKWGSIHGEVGKTMARHGSKGGIDVERQEERRAIQGIVSFLKPHTLTRVALL